MVKIRPINAYLPKPENAKNLAAFPYDAVSREEAKAFAAGNDMSFYRVNKPEIDLPDELDPYDASVYQKGKENLHEFVHKGYLVKDEQPSMYLYGQRLGMHIQFGIFCCASVDDYEKNLIKKHEHTLPKKVQDRVNLCHTQGANAGPVLLAFKEGEGIQIRMEEIAKNVPYINFISDDGIQHTIWKCTQEDCEFFESEFEKIPCSYVADGHHRAEAAYRVGKMRKEKALAEGKEITGKEGFHYFLSIMYPMNQLMILDYNRVIKSLNGMSTEDFISKLGEDFTVSEIPAGHDPKPEARRHISLYLDHKWYDVQPKETVVDNDDPIMRLDTAILTEYCFKKILDIQNIKEDPRIDFVGGIRGMKELERRCSIDSVAAFAVYPMTMDELLFVADKDQIAPPKSTWFEPKARSGLVVRVFPEE